MKINTGGVAFPRTYSFDKKIAMTSYGLADAMIKAREVNNG